MTRRVHIRPTGFLRRLISGLCVGLAVAALAATLRAQSAGNPILVVTSTGNPFSQYYAEILRAEGLNAFSVMDAANVTSTTLTNYDVVILGEMPLSPAQATMFNDWVLTGGNLIAMRPDKRLASLLGLVDAEATLPEAYMLVDTSTAPGLGIVGQTMQFHGSADLYTITDAAAVATLYSTASTATANPAVTVRTVGTAGGQAAAFTYDLARSVVYTRQGNPAWSGQERDGIAPIRSDDLFFGGAQPNYVDLSKVAIPQADEQQRLLVNLIGFMNADRKPLPRFWYFPRGLKAVVVMTGDDHANNGTAGRFDIYNSNSPQDCSVADWQCIRATSYIYPLTPISDAQAATYVAQGFEIGVHITTNCGNYTPTSLQQVYNNDLSSFAAIFPSLPAPTTNRTHCIAWSDFDTQPQVALAHGIRFDTNYYYWPSTWINNVPGVFTGSGMPMRFAKADGTMVDVYQAPTQMTDESGQTYPFTADRLLDRALGPQGYYGAFVANMHTDQAVHAGSQAIVASAQARGVPVVSSKQMLDWLDARNSSTVGSIAWDGVSTATFSVSAAASANGLQTMLPLAFGGRALASVIRDGTPVTYAIESIKGVPYAIFPSSSGSYTAQYAIDDLPPVISGVTATALTNSATISWATNELGTTRVDYGTNPSSLVQTASVPIMGTAHSVQLAGLNLSTTYYYRVTSADAVGNAVAAPAEPNPPATFTTSSCPCSIWTAAQAPANDPSFPDANVIELGTRFRSSINGYITGIRFYKGSKNTGVHVGSLWSGSGTALASVTFSDESAEGWQQAAFSAPVAVTANTTYVVSYRTDTGFYSADPNYFLSGVTSGPLQALANGFDGPNGVFKYGGGFPSDTFNATNYWVDVVLETSVPPDTKPPVVTAIAPGAGSGSVSATTVVTATFSEDLNGGTVNTSSFELRDSANALVPATVTYALTTRTATLRPNAALASSTTYTATIHGGGTGVTDLAGNPLSGDVTWSFTTSGPPPFSVTDTTVADFSGGTPDANIFFSQTADGEVILVPAVGAEFSGAALPAGWSSTAWATGGVTNVTGGQVVADGARASVDTLMPAGRRLEFVATFSPTAASQHVGFGLTFNESPWIIFSTGAGGALYARTNDGTKSVDTLIPGNWLGSPRRYRIDWTASSVTFYIDGTQVATRTVAIGASLRPIISDYIVGGPSVSVDWLRVSPYATSGTFTSRILDAGSSRNWATVSWNAVVPATTNLAIAVRFGNTPVPDASWTTFATVPNSGAQVAATSRYVQYQANLSGTGTDTPELRDVSIAVGVPSTPPTVSVNDVSIIEPVSGVLNATFTVTLSKSGATPITVVYGTASATATSGSDFTPTSGTLTFSPGVTSLTVDVPVLGDTVPEGEETFLLSLSAPVNATLAKSQGVGTIFDSNSTLPSLSIADTSAAEGNSGLTNLTFTVTLSAPSAQMVTVAYSTGGGTATSGSDYSLASGTLTFQPGETQQMVFVSVFGDALFEADETFFVTLGSSMNATIGRQQATGTILNDDAAPALSIGDVSALEGNSGTSNVQIPVTLSAPSGQTVTVAYSTTSGTASAGSDFTTTTGTLTIPAGSTSQNISVPIVGDVLNEPDETFTVSLSNPVGATITRGLGNVTIVDDDKPQVSISSVSVTEGNAAKNVVVTATLSAASTQQITVSFSTADGTALAGSDYVAQSGLLTFAPGTISRPITISVLGDVLDEPDETFTVNLSNPVNATMGTGQAVVTIVDNDAAPSIAITDASVTEGDFGTVSAVVTVSLSAISAQTVTVAYATANGTATAPSDYTATSGTLTFAPGVTSLPVTVLVNGDTVDEANETIQVNLTNPTNATIADARGIITIVDDDPASISINNRTVTEGDTGTVGAVFTVSIGFAQPQPVSVNYATSDGTAVAPADYTAVSGTLTIPAGATSAQITVPIVGDLLDEANETFSVTLSSPVNGIIAVGTGIGTITDNDPTPTLAVNDVNVTEPDTGGTATATFTVTLSAVSGRTVTVNYTTANGTATAPADYTATSGTLTFAPGTTTQLVNVTVAGDVLNEADETFQVRLSAAANATIADNIGVGTIVDNDPLPTATINDVTITEANTGTRAMTFTVTLSAPSGRAITIAYATADGTATAPSDYTAATGTLTFNAGVTTRPITITSIGDTTVEPTETLFVNLSNGVNVTILDAQGVGTILNND